MALVDIVPEENVVMSVNVTVIRRYIPDVKEAHQVDILSMEITKDLAGRPQIVDNDWLSSQDLTNLVGEFDNVLTLDREFVVWLQLLTLLGF